MRFGVGHETACCGNAETGLETRFSAAGSVSGDTRPPQAGTLLTTI